MMFNPLSIPQGKDVLKVHKDLAKHRAFRLNPGEGINNTMLMKWIFCIYDKNSPYRKKYSDVLKRKTEVAHDVGFPEMEGGVFESQIEDFLRGQNRVVNMKIIEFVRMHRNLKYAYFVTMEESYFNIMLDIMGGSVKQLNDARSIANELEETQLELLNQDSNPHIRDELLRYMEEERLLLRPEDIALKLQNGEKPL